MTIQFYAHSGKKFDKSDWQSLESHLLNVGDLAEQFAQVFEAGSWGRLAGRLHDAGKATQAFQQRLEGKSHRVDHSTFGARTALENAGALGYLLSYVIAGHHGGLPDGGSQEKELHYRLKQGKIPPDAALIKASQIKENLVPPFKELTNDLAGFKLAFFTRMVFSCLVDADFLDTEAHCDPERSEARSPSMGHLDGQYRSLASLKDKMDAHLDELIKDAPKTLVNKLRQKILNQCREKAVAPAQIFSLSVPTGGGKTLSSMAFALGHAISNKMRRIIYAIPFTSIIEQNARVFQDILGRDAVLEHHCNYKEKDDPEKAPYEQRRGLAVENWDAPVVVTTNVQFFESFFSHKPSRCRKLHNIAKSVIVLDEAQAIPTEFLEPCLAALRELVENYGCTVVLCTATQPAFDDTKGLRTALVDINEIVYDTGSLYRELRRTKVHFVGCLTNTQLGQKLEMETQALCITATKPEARKVYELLGPEEGVYHLSTNMYPEHRRRVLKRIRKRLKENLPCRVVSTSLVEAGVDLDFPVVYRAMAGLDSIGQAAGRCNREGKLEKDGQPALGQVFVYEPEDPPSMPWLKRCASRAKETLRNLPDADPMGQEVMRKYFELLYDIQETDQKRILSFFPTCKKLTAELILPFKEVGERFRLIEDDTIGVVIPQDPEAEKLLQKLAYAEFPNTILRKLQQYTVAVRRNDFMALDNAGALRMIHDRIPVLSNLNAYHNDLGLCPDKGGVWEVCDLIQ